MKGQLQTSRRGSWRAEELGLKDVSGIREGEVEVEASDMAGGNVVMARLARWRWRPVRGSRVHRASLAMSCMNLATCRPAICTGGGELELKN